jgi:hypothetical protein
VEITEVYGQMPKATRWQDKIVVEGFPIPGEESATLCNQQRATGVCEFLRMFVKGKNKSG